jgi:nitrite reductase (NO-forming)/hydroxylamine reductase
MANPWAAAAAASTVVLLLAACSGPSDGSAGSDAPSSKGRTVYLSSCAACHGPTGQGLAPAFPPLAGSDYLPGNRESVIKGILYGQQGPITVNGTTYDGVMPAFGHLTDDEIAAVATYVFTSWGNSLEPVSAAEVAALRSD